MRASGERDWPGQLFQRCDRGAILPLKEHTRSGVTRPAVGAFERGDQLRGLSFLPGHARSLLKSVGHDAVDAPRSRPLVRSRWRFDLRRQAERMFNHLAIDIDDIQPAVGGRWRTVRDETSVGRGDELAASVGASRDEADALWLENLTVDDCCSPRRRRTPAPRTRPARRRRERSWCRLRR